MQKLFEPQRTGLHAHTVFVMTIEAVVMRRFRSKNDRIIEVAKDVLKGAGMSRCGVRGCACGWSSTELSAIHGLT